MVTGRCRETDALDHQAFGDARPRRYGPLRTTACNAHRRLVRVRRHYVSARRYPPTGDGQRFEAGLLFDLACLLERHGYSRPSAGDQCCSLVPQLLAM